MSGTITIFLFLVLLTAFSGKTGYVSCEGVRNVVSKCQPGFEVSCWLSGIDADYPKNYASAFYEHSYFTAKTISAMNEDDLYTVGVILPGHRKKILRAIEGMT